MDSDVRRRGSLRIVRRNTAQPIITFPEGRFRGLDGDGGFGEAVVACDMLKPCKFPSRDNCQKKFLLPTRTLILLRAQSLVLCSKFQVGDAKEFPQALGFESLGPFFFRISKQCPCFTVIEEDGGGKRHVLLELGCEAASSGII